MDGRILPAPIYCEHESLRGSASGKVISAELCLHPKTAHMPVARSRWILGKARSPWMTFEEMTQRHLSRWLKPECFCACSQPCYQACSSGRQRLYIPGASSLDPVSLGGGMQAPSLSESPLSPLEMRPSVESLRSADSASPTATSVEPSQASKQALQKTSLTSIPEVGSPSSLFVEEGTHRGHGQQEKPLSPLEASTCYGHANGDTASQLLMPLCRRLMLYA